MNLFTKAGPWVVASLMATASAFGQSSNCCPPKPKCCEEMKQIQLMAGYNAPSRIEVRGCWDVYASGSFTYWQPCQDNMELGIVMDRTLDLVHRGRIVNADFGYKPGFKVALGMNFDHDNWDSMVQYAWFRGSETTTTSLNSVTFPTVEIEPISGFTTGQDFYKGTQKWRLHMDLLDWDLARNYYVGTKLTFRPSFGARAAWIRQNYTGFFSEENPAEPLKGEGFSRRSYSWGVGPRAALNTNWALGEGFRLFGNGSGDILFTQYTKLKYREFETDDAGQAVSPDIVITQRKVNCLRSHLELELGLGWGSYFDCNNWHVDLSAGYGFQVFFDQNMFRHFDFVLQNGFASTMPHGNLYVHGLTATARFDF